MSVLFSQTTKKPIEASFYNEEELQKTKKEFDYASLDNITVVKGDIRTLFGFKINYYETALLLDVLEHIEGNDYTVLCNINRLLQDKGRLYLSVPTHMFPKYFGEKFDKYGWPPLPQILRDFTRESGQPFNHLRHYSFPEIKEKLEKAGFRIKEVNYYTLGIDALLCNIWYKRFYKHFFLRIAFFPILNLFSYIFFFTSHFTSKENACSIFVVAEKESNL